MAEWSNALDLSPYLFIVAFRNKKAGNAVICDTYLREGEQMMVPWKPVFERRAKTVVPLIEQLKQSRRLLSLCFSFLLFCNHPVAIHLQHTH